MRNVMCYIALFFFVVTMPLFAGDLSKNGMNQGDLFTFLSNSLSQNRCFSYAAIASAGVNTVVSTITYSIDDIIYTVASANVNLVPAGGPQAVGTTVKYLISYDSSGTATCTAGSAIAVGSTPDLPSTPSGFAPVGYIQLAIAASAATTFGIGSDAYGMDLATFTFYNLEKNPQDHKLTGL